METYQALMAQLLNAQKSAGELGTGWGEAYNNLGPNIVANLKSRWAELKNAPHSIRQLFDPQWQARFKAERQRPGDTENAYNEMMGVALTFAGPMAKTANLAKLQEAKKLATSGQENEAIRQTTGWFQGPEKMWRFEIPDVEAKWTPELEKHTPYLSSWHHADKITTGQALAHPELYAAYPELSNITTAIEVGPHVRPIGEYGKTQAGSPYINVSEHDWPQARSTMLHELQHAIQEKEGFAKGGSPESMLSVLEKMASEAETIGDFAQARKIKDQAGIARWDEGTQAYQRLGGEAEARAVQARMNLTPEQLRTMPVAQSYDVPWANLLFRLK